MYSSGRCIDPHLLCSGPGRQLCFKGGRVRLLLLQRLAHRIAAGGPRGLLSLEALMQGRQLSADASFPFPLHCTRYATHSGCCPFLLLEMHQFKT